jgi:hypothetical protein
VPLVLVGVDPERFWELLATEAAERIGMVLAADGPKSKREQMSYQEAVEFEKTVIPWGAQAGRKVAEVEPRYFLAVTEGRFPRDLQRYLKSTRFLERQA